MSCAQESQCLAVIRVWVALAWADGVIQEAERTAIHTLITAAKLSDTERKIAEGFLDAKVELSIGSISGLASSARESIFRAAVRMALVDLNMAEEEKIMLARLREGLSISQETAILIENSVSAG